MPPDPPYVRGNQPQGNNKGYSRPRSKGPPPPSSTTTTSTTTTTTTCRTTTTATTTTTQLPCYTTTTANPRLPCNLRAKRLRPQGDDPSVLHLDIPENIVDTEILSEAEQKKAFGKVIIPDVILQMQYNFKTDGRSGQSVGKNRSQQSTHQKQSSLRRTPPPTTTAATKTTGFPVLPLRIQAEPRPAHDRPTTTTTTTTSGPLEDVHRDQDLIDKEADAGLSQVAGAYFSQRSRVHQQVAASLALYYKSYQENLERKRNRNV